MAAMRCEACGGSLTMDKNGEFAVCEFCGTKHDMRKTPQVVVVHTLEKLVENAETFLSLKDYAQAEKVYKKITDHFPQDYRGWWGILLCRTKNLTKLDGPSFWYYYERAMRFAPPEAKDKLKQGARGYLERQRALDEQRQLQREWQANIDALQRKKSRYDVQAGIMGAVSLLSLLLTPTCINRLLIPSLGVSKALWVGVAVLLPILAVCAYFAMRWFMKGSALDKEITKFEHELEAVKLEK